MALEWKWMTGREKFEICKADFTKRFDSWFNSFWKNQCSKKEMLSPDSPLPHVYALMCLPYEEAKYITPSNCLSECSDCKKKTEVWLETTFSFCDEYGCGLVLCPECAEKLRHQIERRDTNCGAKMDGGAENGE